MKLLTLLLLISCSSNQKVGKYKVIGINNYSLRQHVLFLLENNSNKKLLLLSDRYSNNNPKPDSLELNEIKLNYKYYFELMKIDKPPLPPINETIVIEGDEEDYWKDGAYKYPVFKSKFVGDKFYIIE